jgi:hypothetical protein
MIDAPGREQARFPANKESVAANAIAITLDQIGVYSRDLAICGGACGGDLLFAEACLRCGTQLEFFIPFDEPTFLAKSVDFANADWHARFVKAKSSAKIYSGPDEFGPSQTDEDPYERNNLWMLNSAARFGQEKLVRVGTTSARGRPAKRATR